MRELNPNIELQELLGQQIFNALQGGVTEVIRQKCEGNAYDVKRRSVMEGNSLKVNETLLPKFYQLCQEVKEVLDFPGEIDFYISGNSEVNACAYVSEDETRPHIIEINSGLFTLMNDEELKFVVGHEIGHLINSDATIKILYNFIYPTDEDKEECPEFLRKRLEMYDQLAELGADRYGYMANENLDACVTAVFKMASGLYLEKMNVSIKELLEENAQRLQYFLSEDGISDGTHPVNPIRIRALELFATSKTQMGLTRGMNELITVIQNFTYSELDTATAEFVAAAGLFVAQKDGKKRDKNEEELILNKLANYCLFPYKELKRIEKGNVVETMMSAAETILNIMPSAGINLLNYFIDVAFADGELEEIELELIFEFGSKLGFQEFDIAETLEQKLLADFTPQVSALK